MASSERVGYRDGPMQPVVRVTVEFMGPFEFDFGVAATNVTLTAPATVATLLEALAVRWPAAQRLCQSLADASPRQGYFYVSLDYRQLPPKSVLEAPLHDGARVCFGMPMAGG